MKVLIFYINEKKYGIELRYCLEVENIDQLTYINSSSQNFKSYVEGITNIRGDIVTLINIKKLLNLEHTDYTNKTLIRLKIHNKKKGILVDEVFDIIDVNTNDIDYSKGHIQHQLLNFIKFTIIYNHEPILVLNPEHL